MGLKAPKLSLILIACVFALSCFGFTLFVWKTFGGPTPLEAHGYRGWYVLEQDTILTAEPTGEGPVADVRASVAHLRSLSPPTCCASAPGNVLAQQEVQHRFLVARTQLHVRQVDRRQHRQSRHPLRRDRPAPDLRPRAAHRRDDALLVARQARADDARRRGRDARAAGGEPGLPVGSRITISWLPYMATQTVPGATCTPTSAGPPRP